MDFDCEICSQYFHGPNCLRYAGIMVLLMCIILINVILFVESCITGRSTAFVYRLHRFLLYVFMKYSISLDIFSSTELLKNSVIMISFKLQHSSNNISRKSLMQKQFV